MSTDARAQNTRNVKKTRKNNVQQDQPREHKRDNEGNLENGDKTRDNQRKREITRTKHEKTTENERKQEK